MTDTTMKRLAVSLVGAGGLAAAGLGLYARHIEPYSPRLETLSLPLPAAHEHLAGLTIGFLADTHVGPFIRPTDLTRATSLLAREHPDLVLYGGDYVSESPRYIKGAAAVLGHLACATRYGGFAVLGNHDLGLVPEKIEAALGGVGISVLRNRAVKIETIQGPLWIAGIDETLIGTPHPELTIAQAPPGAAILALWHEAQFAERAADAGAFAQLSGHSHGGQIRLPFFGPLALPVDGDRHSFGLSFAHGMPVYTTRGVGVYRPPLRLNCRPEVTLIRLVRAADAACPREHRGR
jgi:predicted MPP superfamily phosphohydrolase